MPSIRTIITMIKNQINPRKLISSASKEQCHTKCVTSIKQYIRKLHEAVLQKWSAIMGRERGPGPALEKWEVTEGCICEQKHLRGGSSSNTGSIEGSLSSAALGHPPSCPKAKERTSSGLTISGAHRTENVPRRQEGWADTQGAEVRSSEGLH